MPCSCSDSHKILNTIIYMLSFISKPVRYFLRFPVKSSLKKNFEFRLGLCITALPAKANMMSYSYQILRNSSLIQLIGVLWIKWKSQCGGTYPWSLQVIQLCRVWGQSGLWDPASKTRKDKQKWSWRSLRSFPCRVSHLLGNIPKQKQIVIYLNML